MLRSETAASPDRFAAAMAGLRAYQAAARQPPAPPMPIVHRAGRAMLRDYGGGGRPVVFVPSLINPPTILDLGERSLMRWMVAQGFRVLLVDWGDPQDAPGNDRDLDLTAHVERMLLPMVRGLEELPVLVGYCLGGTLAIGAAAVTPVAGLATLAAPWRFAGYGDARAAMLRMWHAAKPICAALGLVPIELLQAGFWRLDPLRTIGKYEAFGRMEPDSAAARSFVQLEDWANAGAPLPFAAACELFEAFIGRDAPSAGKWLIGGTSVDPATLKCPAIEIVSRTDRIVPADTAAGMADRRDLAMGHVGMIVGGRAREALWEPLAAWIGSMVRPN